MSPSNKYFIASHIIISFFTKSSSVSSSHFINPCDLCINFINVRAGIRCTKHRPDDLGQATILRVFKISSKSNFLILAEISNINLIDLRSRYRRICLNISPGNNSKILFIFKCIINITIKIIFYNNILKRRWLYNTSIYNLWITHSHGFDRVMNYSSE